MWRMLFFSDSQKGCPVSVLRQLVHYAVQVQGRKIFTHCIIPWTQKIGITAEKIHSNSYFLIYIPEKKEEVFGFAFGILSPRPP